MTKSDLFKAAHKIARETKEDAGSYRIAFSCALKRLYAKGEKPMAKDQKVTCIVRYLMKCGCKTEEIARATANDLVASGDDMSLIAKRFDEEKCEWQSEKFVENFSCMAEYQGWLMDQANVEMMKKFDKYVLLKASDPFYNSIWGQIPQNVADQCCEAVQKRIRVGM